MREYFNVLKSVSLFKGIESGELEAILKCLGADIKKIKKNEIILLAGDKPRAIGVVLSGRLHIIREDFDGNRSLVAAVTSGEIFAEAMCCAGTEESPVTVFADENAAVMLLKFDRVLRTCPNSCVFHQRLIENMLRLVANKNLFMQGRMEIMAIKSIRGRVLRYLETLSPKRGRNIAVPFNREGMADYLCVERSALSHELSKMKKDGLIEYKKNRFVVI